jgi:tetratricopeptide (TPR) repeat protein
MPNNGDVIALKAGIYQAEGNLQEAAKLLSDINWQTPSAHTFRIKITQLRLERNLGETVRLLQARQTQFHFTSEIDKGFNQFLLAWTQRLAGDTAGAKATAEQARNTLEQLCKDQPDNSPCAGLLSLANAVLGEKNSALKEIQRAIMLLPSAKDRVIGPILEEGLALIQMTFGENSRAISTLCARTRVVRKRIGDRKAGKPGQSLLPLRKVRSASGQARTARRDISRDKPQA